MEIAQELLEILVAFGGGRGGEPGQVVVRFLLPAFFWAILAAVAFREYRRMVRDQDLSVGVAALAGLVRELLMFTAEYGSLRGWVDFDRMYHFYPPLEHAATATSSVLIAAAFIYSRKADRRFAVCYLTLSMTAIGLIYAVTATVWPTFLATYPRSAFGLFWGDLAFRSAASLLLFTALALKLSTQREDKQTFTFAMLGLIFLFLDEFLMIFNILSGERYVAVYAPIRHNLHIWAIPCLLASYWYDLRQSLSKAFSAALDEKVKLHSILDSIGDAVMVTDRTGAVILVNKVAEQLTGCQRQDAIGRPLDHVFRIFDQRTREALPNPVDRVMVSGTINDVRTTLLIGTGDVDYAIEYSAAPVLNQMNSVTGVVLAFRDVTMKHRLEEELARMDKMKSVGLLAGGIAHDFNNLLMAILGNISLAKTYLDKDNRAYLRLEEAEKASNRATDLSRQLLTFAKGGAPIKEAVALEELIRECASFTLAGTSISIRYLCGDAVRQVSVDPGQISQVFNNLIINAIHAMPNGGTLTCAIDSVTIGENGLPGLAEGDYVRVSLEDSGTGIQPDHIDHIFEPFFTTKAIGNGLGLATAYSIIQRHNGHIDVTSRLGHGTIFNIYLPAATVDTDQTPASQQVITTGHGRILLMDDEEMVLDVAAEMIKSLDYEVVTARNGEETLALYGEALRQGGRFAAVIMDLTVVGGSGGRETIGRLRELDPSAVVLVSSGYSNDPVMAEYDQYGFDGVITKPYTLASLSRSLKDATSSTGKAKEEMN